MVLLWLLAWAMTGVFGWALVMLKIPPERRGTDLDRPMLFVSLLCGPVMFLGALLALFAEYKRKKHLTP